MTEKEHHGGWTYAQSRLVKYWIPLADAGSPLARENCETVADWVQRVGMADPINREIQFRVDGQLITLTRTRRDARPAPDCHWASQIRGNAAFEGAAPVRSGL